MLWILLAALLASSLSSKALFYGDPEPSTRERDRIVGFFERRGFSSVEETGLIEGAESPVLHFRHRHCAERIQATNIAPNGETMSMFAQRASSSGRVFYVYDGVASDAPPARVYVKSKIGTFLHQLGLIGRAPMLVGVVEPVGCPIRASLPWSQL